MPVKYQCPKCEKRFVDWGAEKLGFRCPYCTDVPLLRLGAPAEQLQIAPSLRRSPAKAKKLPEKMVIHIKPAIPDNRKETEETGLENEALGLETEDEEETAVEGEASEGEGAGGSEGEEEELPEDLDFENGILPERAVEDFENAG